VYTVYDVRKSAFTEHSVTIRVLVQTSPVPGGADL